MAGTSEINIQLVDPGGVAIIMEKFVAQQGIIAGLDPSKAGQAGAAQKNNILSITGPYPFEGTFPLAPANSVPPAPPAGFVTTWWDSGGQYNIMGSNGVIRKI